MASIRETVFSEEEIHSLIARARGQAAHMLERNRQDHYIMFESLATALQQVVNERNTLRGASDAGRTTPEEGPDPSGAEQADPPKRKRVQR